MFHPTFDPLAQFLSEIREGSLVQPAVFSLNSIEKSWLLPKFGVKLVFM
jgi:hypothetical protein